MTTKEILLEELGDFGKEDGEQTAIANDGLPEVYFTEEEAKGLTRVTELEDDPDEFDDFDDESGEEVEEESETEEVVQAPEGDLTEPGAILRLGPNGRLTEEQLEANIEAVTKALGDDSLKKPAYVWGMNYLDDLFKEQAARWDKAIAEVDVEEERRLYGEDGEEGDIQQVDENGNVLA